MARARREYEAHVHKSRDVLAALALCAWPRPLHRELPAVAGKPFFGYLRRVSSDHRVSNWRFPALVAAVMRISSRWLGRAFGPEALLASRSLGASLRRTSVLVAALSTAIAMMVSVGIMVGSFRETVIDWMAQQLPAICTSGRPVFLLRTGIPPFLSMSPTLSPSSRAIDAVDRLRALRNHLQRTAVMLGAADLSAHRAHRGSDFFLGTPGRPGAGRASQRQQRDVSEPFTYKHRATTGDTISLGTRRIAC